MTGTDDAYILAVTPREYTAGENFDALFKAKKAITELQTLNSTLVDRIDVMENRSRRVNCWARQNNHVCLVRGYTHLFDCTVPGHRDKQKCMNSWEEIALAVELPVKNVQKKWNLARDRFVRAHDKGMSKKSGDDAGGPEHPILTQLAWLKVHI